MLKLFKKISLFSLSSYRVAIIAGEVLFGVGLCLFSLLFFLYFASEIAEKESTSIDMAVSMFVYSLRTPFLTQVMIFVTSFGANIGLVLAALVGIVLLLKKHRKEAVLFCLVLIMGVILNNALKFLYQRPRPNMSPLVVEHNYSFPSGHAMNSFIFYALLAYFSHHFFHNKKITMVVTIVASVIVGLIGFSRIYLGVHYFTDVLAGYLAGFWWFITVLLIERTLIFYKLYKDTE